MDIETLLPLMLKLALDTNQVKPEEVMAILQNKQQGKTEDKNTETVDGDVIDTENPTNDDINNQEGKILESSFKELEIEDAIEKAQELKELNIPIGEQLQSSNTITTVQKVASCWDVLKEKYNLCHK